MSAAKVQIALVGVGGIGAAYAQMLRRSETAELVAVADSNLELASRAAEPIGCRVFDTHASLLRAGGFEAAIVCTPPASHASIAIELMRCGVHILCEKPLSTEMTTARRMLQVAKSMGVTLAMASKFRYVEDVVEAKSLISKGLLGDVMTFENAFASRTAMRGRWNSNPAISGGGVIIDNGTHSVDILRYLCGPIIKICAYEGHRVQQLPVEDTAHMIATTASGVLATIDLSWNCDVVTDSYLRVYGTDGALKLDWKGSRYRRGGDQSWIEFGRGYSKLDALSAEVDNFCRSLRGEEPLLISSADALASVQAIAAAYRSLSFDRWVAVDAVERLESPDLELMPASAAI